MSDTPEHRPCPGPSPTSPAPTAARTAASADAGLPPGLHLQGPVATLSLRRPAQANRLSLSDVDTLIGQVAEVNTQHGVRVLQLRSEGRHFCSGFDLNQVGEAGAAAVARFEALAQALEDARPVTVAAIQGGAYGGGVDLALACDFRLGTTACQMAIPASKLGLHFYRGGMERLVSRLGLGVAKRLLLAAHTLDADALQACGLLDSAVPPDALPAELDRWTDELCARAPLALLPMKQHLNAIARHRLDEAALHEDMARAAASQDLKEGSRAWAEKRAPVFRGR